MNEIKRQLSDALEITCREGGRRFDCELCLSSDFFGFQGHFPGEPVLPGICMISAVLVAGEKQTGERLRMTHLKFAKFYSPVRPQELISMAGEVNDNGPELAVTGNLNCGERKVAKISMVAERKTDCSSAF